MPQSCKWCFVEANCIYLDNRYLCSECAEHWRRRDDYAGFHFAKDAEELKANIETKRAEAVRKEKAVVKVCAPLGEKKPLLHSK